MPIVDEPDGATSLDPDEMAGIKFKHVTTRGQLDHLEQASIESGLQWLSRRKNNDLLNEAFTRELHKKLFGDVWRWGRGVSPYRKNIGVESAYLESAPVAPIP